MEFYGKLVGIFFVFVGLYFLFVSRMKYKVIKNNINLKILLHNEPKDCKEEE